MDFVLTRKYFADDCTIGELSLAGQFIVYILEDIERPTKIKHKTAIPVGRYQIVVNESARFKRELPQLLNVPNYAGIRIHAGNTAADTSGCLLPGLERSANSVGNSRVAFEKVFKIITRALSAGEEVWISIYSERKKEEHE